MNILQMCLFTLLLRGSWVVSNFQLLRLVWRRQRHPTGYSCLENPVDGGAWKAAVHGVAECRTRLSKFTFTFHFHALEKEMATRSSVLAWTIPGMGGAWWAAVYGVAQSQTRLKWLSSSSSNSAYKLNQLDGSVQPFLTPFPILNQLVVPCKVPYVGMYVCIHSLFR